MMKCLPLHSCTFDSNRVGKQIYKFLPDSIRHITDTAEGNSEKVQDWDVAALSEPCLTSISALHLKFLPLHDMSWFDHRPVSLQCLTVSQVFYCSKEVLLRFAELFPALTFVDVAVNPNEQGAQILQQLLHLPQLARAHFRFSRLCVGGVRGLAARHISRLVLAPPDTVTLQVFPFDGVQVQIINTQAKDH